MQRAVALVSLYVFLFGSLPAAPEPEDPAHKSLVRHLFGPKGFFLSGFSTAINHVRNVPQEWGSGLAGLGKRFASGFGQHLVKGTAEFGLAKALHEDLKYYPSEKPGFGPRVEHAVLSTFYVPRTKGEGETIAKARISGNLTGGFVSRLWMPARFHTVASGFASTGISLAAETGLNVFREFWPEIRHPRRRRQAAAEKTYVAVVEVVELDGPADGMDQPNGCR
jgi:hypothetical protein